MLVHGPQSEWLFSWAHHNNHDCHYVAWILLWCGTLCTVAIPSGVMPVLGRWLLKHFNNNFQGSVVLSCRQARWGIPENEGLLLRGSNAVHPDNTTLKQFQKHPIGPGKFGFACCSTKSPTRAPGLGAVTRSRNNTLSCCMQLMKTDKPFVASRIAKKCYVIQECMAHHRSKL